MKSYARVYIWLKLYLGVPYDLFPKNSCPTAKQLFFPVLSSCLSKVLLLGWWGGVLEEAVGC